MPEMRDPYVVPPAGRRPIYPGRCHSDPRQRRYPASRQGTAWRTIWLNPRLAVRQAVDGDAAGFVIAVAWLSGIADILQSAYLRGSLKPHWGPFVLLMAFGMGPLLGFAHFAFAGWFLAGVGRLFGGTAESSEARVALACGTVPELLALPLWIPVFAVHGLGIFTTERGPHPTGLIVFLVLQAVLFVWAWALRLLTIAEAHGFSVWRALGTIVLGWLAAVVVLVGSLVGAGALLGK